MNAGNFITSFVRDFYLFDFWRLAVAGGFLVSISCSILSVYVVLKRMAFIGQGISHSAFGGIALGILLFSGTAAADAKIYATTLIFCILVAFLIGATTRHSRISEDSAIGIFFVVSMALGVIFIKSTPGYNQDVFGYLFGSVLLLTSSDLWVIAGDTVLVTGVILLFYKELTYYTFDESMAAVSGVPVRFLHYMMLALLSFTIVISVKMVGIILISAFLILPGAIAQLLASRFNFMVLWSIASGLVTMAIGILVSHGMNWPTGATVVIVQFAVFVTIFLIRRLQGTLSA
jgi:zinc transport system permease protein